MFRYILAINQTLNMHRRAAHAEQEKMQTSPCTAMLCSPRSRETTAAAFLALFSGNTGYHHTQNANELMVLHIKKKIPQIKKANPQ